MAAADEKQGKSTVREYYEALLIAILFVNFTRIFVFQAFKIPSGSMEDNLKIGDHIIVNKFIYGPKGDNFLTRLLPMRGVDFGVQQNALAHGGRLIDVFTPYARYNDVFLPLHGAYQADNAVIALTAAESFLD